jgi:predicted metal-dependent phosphoesterase TrpH
MQIYANLHLHSTHSDGKYTPEELVLLAKQEGYGAIALTDHDTVTGNADIAYYAKKHGLESIFGCEFSVQGQGKDDFHFVAFDFDPAYPPMAEYLKGMAYRQTHQTKAYFDLGVEKGCISGIAWEEVLSLNEGIEWFCNEQVFSALLKKGVYKREDYEKWVDTCWYPLYKELRVPPAYPFLGPKGIIDLVHAAGGIILIAHPHGVLDQIDRLVALGLDGIEVYHPDLTPEEQTEAMRIAYEKNLFVAGGTDHSGLLGGEYISFKNPEECPYYLEPRVFGTMEEHFHELKERKIGKREYKHTHTARRGKYL